MPALVKRITLQKSPVLAILATLLSATSLARATYLRHLLCSLFRYLVQRSIARQRHIFPTLLPATSQDKLEVYSPKASSVFTKACVAAAVGPKPAPFQVGSRIAHIDGKIAVVMDLDEEGDVRVRRGNLQEATWHLARCSAAPSIGDEVRYGDGDIGVIEEFDEDGDVIARLRDGSTRVWYSDLCRKLLHIGDPVCYACGDVGVVTGFDVDGDVFVRRSDGSTATWLLRNCSQGPAAIAKHESHMDRGCKAYNDVQKPDVVTN